MHNFKQRVTPQAMLKARLESDEELTKSGGAGGRTNATLNIDRYLDELGKSIEHEKPIEPRTNRYSTNRFHRLSSDTSDSLLTSGLESDHKSTRMLGGKRQQDLHGRTSTPIPMDNATLAQFSSSASQVSSVHSLAVSNGTLADSQTALYQSSHHDHGTSSSAGSTVSIGHHRTGNLLPPNLRTLPPPSSAMQTMSAPTNVFPVSSRPKKRLDDVEVGIDMHSDATSTIHFATPFEFSNKMPRKSLDRKSHPTIRLVWRNVTYRASGSRKTNNSASTVSSSGASSSTIPSGSSMSDHRPYHHQRSKSSGNSSDSSLAGKRKLILDRQSGEIHGGQLTAIIGPSGAGKSTLLECLAGRRSLRLSGHVYLEYPPEYVAAGQRVRISFIAQKDTVIAMLTVRETLLFASKLKNYRLIKNAHYHMRLVNALLHELQLDKCAEIAACRISGGQLKRLSFALELISGPDILLLDEPTSGLDSSSAGSTITLLRRLTDLRRSAPTASAWRYKPPAILCSIHQPSASVLQLFHRIYVLSNDGRCVYNGSPFNLLPHLARFDLHCPQFHNPADFIVEVASGDYGSAAINQLAKHCRLASERYNDEHDGDNDDDDEDDDGHDDIESGSVDSTVFDSKPYEQDKRKGRIHDSDAAVEDHHRAYNYQDSYRKYGQPEYISEDGGPGNRRDAKSNGHRHATAGQRKRTRNSNSRSYAPSAAIASGRMKRVKVTKVLQRMRQQRYPLWTHFWLLLRRTYLTTSRDPKLTWFRILQALFIGGVMAFLYDYPIGESDACILDTRNASSVEDDFGNTLNSRTQDNIAFIFFITLFTVMASMMPTVLTFPAEVTVLIQERNNGMSLPFNPAFTSDALNRLSSFFAIRMVFMLDLLLDQDHCRHSVSTGHHDHVLFDRVSGHRTALDLVAIRLVQSDFRAGRHDCAKRRHTVRYESRRSL